MKKIKQILALAGVIILIGLYLLTLLSSITDNPNSMNYFAASIVATVMIPVLLWAYSFIYRLLSGKGTSNPDEASAGKSTQNADKAAARKPEEPTADCGSNAAAETNSASES